jgi:hypothetical protein
MKWATRVLAAVVLVAINVPIVVVPALPFLPKNIIWYELESDGRMKAFQSSPRGVDKVLSNKLVIATVIVLVIFLADVLILWTLSKIGGPLKADVKASLKKFGGSVWIGSAGLLGAFLAIAFLGFGAVYLFAR